MATLARVLLLVRGVVQQSMDRRTFIVSAAVGLSSVSAGCISDVADTGSEASPETTLSTTPTTQNETDAQSNQTKSDYGTGAVEDVKIYNKTNSKLTITVTITRIPEDVPHRENAESSEQSQQRDLSGQPTLISETFELSPYSDGQHKKAFPDPITTRNTYEIKIDVQDGPTATYDWTGEYDNAFGVLIYIQENSIEFNAIES